MEKIQKNKFKGNFMKNYKKLNMNGTLLDKNQFAKHIEKTASEHGIKSF